MASCLIRSMLVAEANRSPDTPTDELMPWLLDAAIAGSKSERPVAPITTPSDAALVRALSEASDTLPVAELLNSLRGYSLEECEAQLQAGRPAFLSWCASLGIAPLKTRQALANFLQKRRRTQARSFGHVVAAGRQFTATDLPSEWPYTPADFIRQDTTDDGAFYEQPRLASHIHDSCSAALTAYYLNALPRNADVLDLCSSWTSHLPPSEALPLGRVAGLGMNMKELEANASLTERCVKDLNASPTLPYSDGSFDAALCTVSLDYLIKPREVLTEVYRCIRPGGMLLVAFSNRCFATKAVAMWLKAMDEGGEAMQTAVATLLRFGGGWVDIGGFEITGMGGAVVVDGNPMYVVQAVRRYCPLVS